MSVIVGVMLRKTKDRIYAGVEHLTLKLSDKVILVTEHGIELGVIYESEKYVKKNDLQINRILRKMTISDKAKLIENEMKGLEVQEIVAQKANEYGLDMKLTCVQYTFDRSKLFVYYTSEIRIDFRSLIKELGRILKTRIQMVQIGVRDESKMIGGLGTCGQILCCKNFLKDFNSITIDMTKEQDLSLNTAKLSGLCGRLKCCIFYENDIYKDARKGLPEIGAIISTPEGKAKLIAIDFIRENVVVSFDSNKLFKVFAIQEVKDGNKR
jgi:cell fate regulator YaaT (PSP1 superfamily)